MFGLYDKILGHPFVYDKIRPLVVGGIELGPLYELLPREARRAILDVGCGTGDALRYLEDFDRYLGVDTDEVAVRAARRRWGQRPNARFEARVLRDDDVDELAPTGVVLSGLLHHLPDAEAIGVLRAVGRSPRLIRVVTCDIVIIPGKLFNNLLARLDRGRYCRRPEGYAALAAQADLVVETARRIPSSPKNDRVEYHVMALSRRSPARSESNSSAASE